MANTKLSKPETETWFIIWGDSQEIIGYGSVKPTQVMETKWTEIHYFESEEEWLNILLENNIDPNPIEEEEEIEE